MLDVVEAKRKGKEVHGEPAVAAEEPEDLMAALRASLEAAQSRRGSDGRKASSRSGSTRRTSSSRSKAKTGSRK